MKSAIYRVFVSSATQLRHWRKMRDDYVPGEIETASDTQARKENCRYDADAADKICRFAETFFKIREGHHAGERLRLLPWQRYVLSQIFGWKRKTNYRRFRRAFVSVAAGQGKNILAEIVALYCLLCDHEPAPYIVSAANSRRQAAQLWRGMDYQISLWPDEYRNPLVRSESKLSIKHPKGNGDFLAIAADGGKSIHGESISCAVINEFAWWLKPDLYHAILSRFRSRKQPLLLTITTGGTDKSNEAYREYQTCKNLLNNEIVDTEQFAFIAEGDQDCPIDDPIQWAKANVSLGTAVMAEDLAKLAESAKFSRSKEMVFRQAHLNNWTAKLTRFLDLDKFDLCAQPKSTWPDLRRSEIWLGCDLAQKIDLNAMIGLVPYNGKIYVLSWAWVPEEATKKQNNSRYREFEREGSLTVVPGNQMDQRLIRKKILEIKEDYRIKKIIIESHEAGLIAQDLMDDFFGCDVVHTPPPSYNTYSEALKALEAHILDRKFIHDGSELLRFQAANLQVKRNARGQLFPAKELSKENIDSLVALCLALTQLILTDPDRPPVKSIYDTPGFSLYVH